MALLMFAVPKLEMTGEAIDKWRDGHRCERWPANNMRAPVTPRLSPVTSLQRIPPGFLTQLPPENPGISISVFWGGFRCLGRREFLSASETQRQVETGINLTVEFDEKTSAPISTYVLGSPQRHVGSVQVESLRRSAHRGLTGYGRDVTMLDACSPQNRRRC